MRQFLLAIVSAVARLMRGLSPSTHRGLDQEVEALQRDLLDIRDHRAATDQFRR
jgi:hypothetical protein